MIFQVHSIRNYSIFGFLRQDKTENFPDFRKEARAAAKRVAGAKRKMGRITKSTEIRLLSGSDLWILKVFLSQQ